jgi:hypothetical protein
MKILLCVIDGKWVATLQNTSFCVTNISREEAISGLRDKVALALGVAVSEARRNCAHLKETLS